MNGPGQYPGEPVGGQSFPRLPSGCVRELLVCINGVGPDQPSPPLLAVRDFCTRHAISLREVSLSSAEQAPADAHQRPRSSPGAEGQGALTCRVLLAAWRGKPRAMNTLWQWAYGDLLLFCDADVRIEQQAIADLYARMRAEPQLGLVAAREVPMLEPKTSIWSRMGALPYRFNFGNAGGRLFLLRKEALSEPMPEDLLLEDAWLTVAVGKQRVRKVMQAQVFFVLPQTWRDYFAERVRAEGGKMQIRRQHARLLANGPVAAYPWAEFLRTIRIREYGLILLALGLRGLARLWAWRRLRRGRLLQLIPALCVDQAVVRSSPGQIPAARTSRSIRNATMKVSIIVLAWNSAQRIEACLASLPAGLTASHEVIVVDNGSQDQTVSVLRARFPHVRIIANRKNRGVAPARNQGIRCAQGEYILILDDDTIVHPAALDQLVQLLDSRPEVGLCGPKLVDAEGRLCLSCRLFPTLLDKLGRRFPSALTRRAARRAELADWAHDTLRPVDYMIGACQLIRRRALDEVGLLDERIFYGPEDVDLCLRMHQAGWQVVYQPAAVVTHAEQRIARSALSRLGWKHLRGLAYYFWKHRYIVSRRALYARFPNAPRKSDTL